MSKRNRNKFRDRERSEAHHSPTSAGSSHLSMAHSAQGTGTAAVQHAAEYRIIRGDMIRLVVLNALVLGAVLVVFYTNRTSGYLERLFEQVF